jgi:transcriptional regulator with XRE-family HTH domain
MRALLHTACAALLGRTGTSQAGFARLTGLTPRQVNNWCRGRAAVPPWAAALAVLLEERSPEAITLLVEETAFAWHETIGVPPNAAGETVRQAIRRLALRYHPDQGGTEAQMTRVNDAYAQAGTTPENRSPAGSKAPPRP